MGTKHLLRVITKYEDFIFLNVSFYPKQFLKTSLKENVSHLVLVSKLKENSVINRMSKL